MVNSYKNTAKAVHFHASNNEKYGGNIFASEMDNMIMCE